MANGPLLPGDVDGDRHVDLVDEDVVSAALDLEARRDPHSPKRRSGGAGEGRNTRDASHPMKGHPGYQGDHVDYCIDICKRVGSPRMKLLFDVYHVQIQDGDVIRRLHQNKEFIGHVHVAGNPGRGELDNKQEINFPPIMQALLDIGYKGYVGQEFIPTRDPFQGLHEAVTLCDV